MPYTPPSQRSPVASRVNTPPRSLSISTQTTTETHAPNNCSNGTRPSLPQSSGSKSYIHKHRRSPSISKSTDSFTESTASERTRLDVQGSDSEEERHKSSPVINSRNRHAVKVNGSTVRNSAPSGSPPSSSDDEFHTVRGRISDVASLAELQAAIRNIEQHRESSPAPPEDKENNARRVLGSHETCQDPRNKLNEMEPEQSSKLPLSAGARNISHSRSSTDASAFQGFPRNKLDPPARSASESELDEMEEEDLEVKPSLIRKKSGELVRPALRASSKGRRPSSMPGTPTYSKAVHFQENSLEHVRHFLQVDRPIAVSAGSSPVESFDDDVEFPFGDGDSRSSSPPHDWEIRLPNFPRETVDRAVSPVRTEKVYLSPDTRVLMGKVAVRNLSFHKLVVARFTLDYWKTTSEVVAEYDNDVRKTQTNDGYDRFTFNIKLEDQANLENKTMFFCVRYNVGGQDYWDNNNSINYQVDFSKKCKLQNGKKATQANSTRPLPRNKPPQPRPRSMPSFDDFSCHQGPYDFSSFPQPNSMVGDSPIRFRNKSSKHILPDAPEKPKGTANQQAFGNRYDFGASLSAAIQAASASMPKTSTPTTEAAPVLKAQPAVDADKAINTSRQNEKCQPTPPNALKPTALTTDKPALQSTSYHELLDKYCFVRSRPTVEHKEQTGLVR